MRIPGVLTLALFFAVCGLNACRMRESHVPPGQNFSMVPNVFCGDWGVETSTTVMGWVLVIEQDGSFNLSQPGHKQIEGVMCFRLYDRQGDEKFVREATENTGGIWYAAANDIEAQGYWLLDSNGSNCRLILEEVDGGKMFGGPLFLHKRTQK